MMFYFTYFNIKILIILSLFFSGNFNNQTNSIDQPKPIVLSYGYHSAFPDAIKINDEILFSYRSGKTHASDKGVIIISNLLGTKKLTIENNNFDLRNGYFVKNNDQIFFFCSIYNYVEKEFIGVNKYEIHLSKYNITYNLISKESYHVIYDPFNLELGSFSNFKNNGWFVDPTKANSFSVPDEEISFFIYNGDTIGIGRNEKSVGLPLLIYKLDNRLLNSKNWCFSKNNTALVSPKVYIIDEKIVLTYTEREEVYYINYWIFKIKNYERSSTNILIFEDLKSFEDCNFNKIVEINTGNNIDSGYPALIFKNKNIILFTYEWFNGKTSIVQRTLTNFL